MEPFYLVYSDNAQRGPYSVAQLETMVRNGEIPANAVVWTEGMRDWQPINTVVSAQRAAPPVPQRLAPPLTGVPGEAGVKESDYTYMLVAHILMAASILTGGLASVIAVVMAYVKQGEVRGTYLESHAQNIIATFWWSLLIGIVGLVLTIIGVGLLILLGGFVWFVYRCIIGIVRLSERRAV